MIKHVTFSSSYSRCLLRYFVEVKMATVLRLNVAYLNDNFLFYYIGIHL